MLAFLQRTRTDKYYNQTLRRIFTLWEKIRKGYVYEKTLELCRPLVETNNSLVLDVGAGTGRFYDLIKDHEVIFLDYAEVMINALKQRFGGKERVSIIRGDGRFLPFKESSVSFVVLLRFLAHYEDQMSIILESKRVLRVGGYILLDKVKFLCLTTFLSKLFRIVDFHPSRDFERVLVENGFVVEKKFDYFFLPAIIYTFIPRVLSRIVDTIPFFRCRRFYKVRKI